MFSSTEHGDERKTTLKMKPHRVRKPFQVAAGHSIKTIPILQSIHMHQNNYTQHIHTQHTQHNIDVVEARAPLIRFCQSLEKYNPGKLKRLCPESSYLRPSSNLLMNVMQ